MYNYHSMRRFIAAMTMVTAVVSGNAVLADDDEIAQFVPFGYGMRNAPMMTIQVDTNDDGIVSASEASQHANAGFILFDSDGDNQITEDEYMDSAPVGMPVGRRVTERLYVNRTERFKGMDADGDGHLTLAEFMAKAQQSYEAADGNGDAVVTVWEFRAQQNPF